MKICILFFQDSEIIFYHIFFIFNLDFFRALILQKCIGSMYLLLASPPTVLGQSFSNFTGAFRMVRRYAYYFFRILKLFYHIFFLLSPAFSKKSGGTLFLVFRGAWCVARGAWHVARGAWC